MGSPAAAAAADSAQWLSVKEETIFLHDGLIRVTDLAELPSEIIGVAEPGDTELEILTFETKNPTELAERLRSVCGNQSNAYARLLEYRLNALRGLWNAQRQLALEEQHERENSGDEETLALLKRQGLLQQPEQAPFTSRMGLLLVFPLIQSQSRTDPSLCNITAEVLLNCLRDCQPLSLTKEPADCLNGIESLLCSWLEETSASGQQIPYKQKENAAAALVALACARGSLKTFVHTVHLLQKQTDLGSLPVADVLYRLLLLEGGPGSPSCLLGGKHMVSWGFEDMLPAPDANSGSSSENKDADLGRCLAADGLYLYTTNSVGRGISKLGSGLHGTLRGFVYCRNEELETGWVAFGNGKLLHRPVSFDNKPHSLFQVIDQNTLQVCHILPMPVNHFPVGSTMTTVHLSSDGTYFYWIWSPASLNEKTPKGHSVFMDIFELIVENDICIANPLQERIILMRKEGESAKSINEMLLSRLSRYRASPSATLAALTGSTISNTLKEDQAAANTSCGLPLKMLRKTPMYTCGTYLVMLVPPPGGSGSSATRSLFGGTSGLSSLKILASSLVYNISDGQFTSRADLIDAAGSSLGRGALIPGLGACYDTRNNMIWTCSNDYIDQWCNPGNQAFHYVCQRLGVSHIITEPRGDAITTSEVINQLLHHVGAMCIHQLNLLAASNNLPITNFLGKQHPIEAHHLSSICDIMEKAMVNGDTCIIRCILVVFQVVFKFFFSPQTERNRDIVRRSGLLLWQLLMAPKSQICPEIQKEVCLAISSGLNILYPGEVEINNLLKLVLTEGERNSGLSQLRDVILTNLAEQLQNNRFGSEDDDHYRLNDELLHYILKIVVRESCFLITKCQIVSKDEFQRLLSTVPAASSCLRYLMAVQNHLLSNTILIKPDENDDSDSSLQGETLKVQELKTSILALATQILTGCDEVLEMLQQVTTALINSDISDREQRLKGLEQVTKATMLGHLLPVLLTSLMHPNLQTLTMADALMPQLVQLVLYTSQTALLLKTQSPVFSEVGSSPSGTSEQKSKLFPEERMLEEKEEPGFLTGLKIPAPWAAGKTVETVHPVRDNYKFKETVHIPGARCLYLRFDSRCSSQYDYDKVEGDIVTFSFEMRSGREHNTPDKAMWGFACTVRAQESSEDVSGGLPFLVDLALGLSVLACSMLRILYNGPEITKDEETCQELLRSKLLQRCQWQVEANGVISPALTPSPSPLPLTIDEDREFTYPSDVLVPPVGHYFDLPRIRLPPGIMIKLREISGRARPQFRPSIKEVIQPDVMEEMVVSCVIKHLNLVDALQSLINFQYQEEHAEEYDLLCKIMGETFKKLNAMERQLQSVAELEQRWQNEVDDAIHGKLENNVPFFYDYHFNESKMKELELLCSMKEISFDGSDLENMVLSLREKFFQEVNSLIQKPSHPLAKTKTLVKSLMNRAELLLHVTIAAQAGITRSISGTPAETPACKSASETKVISHAVRQPVFLRSMSAPSDLEMIGNEDLEFTRSSQRRRHVTSHRSSSFTLLQSLTVEDSRDKPTYSVLLGQLFAFIGTNPDQAVSSSSFLLAAQTRWRRGNTRKQALVHMRELLTAAVRVGGVTHLVGPVTMVLQGGPRIEELTCGGMVEQVQEAFGETMTSVVSLCARYPIACANSIGLLCTIPYTRSEEKCLVRSGLVQLMDRLCSLSSQTESSSNEKQTKKQKVATMAWAAFQVLANRCVEWEKEEGGSTEAVHSGLARQVSSLLTNHLARATECCGNQAAGNDALQDVLSLLNDLSRSHIGKAILSQPACVSKLLSLLLDQRPSPKLVLIILQLCRAALPLMSVEDCGNVELPPWSYSVPSLNSEQDDPSDPASKIASLLLAKLADYVVPGCQTVLSPTASEPDTTLAKTSPKNSIKGDKDPGEESEAVDGKLSIFIHKREDQSSHEVLQPLLSSSEGRPFRLGTGANMEKVVKMDRDMTKSGCCEVITEEAAAALRKATKWAQSGLIVSVGPPIESVSPETTSGLSTGDKKKTAQTSICRERNSELARTDPVRPFISGHVANSMAAEVIALLHSLLMAPESNAAQIWTTTAEKVLSRALMYIPQLGKYAESILENGSSSGRKLAKLQRIARQAVAALCALGGFKETIKIGSEVQVLGRGIAGSIGVVASINEQEGIATVRFPPASIDCRKTSQASDILTIPLSRLCVPRSEALPLHKLSITEKVVQAVQSMLLPQEGSLSIHTSLPATGDGSTPVMAVVRLLGEIRTRACLVMAQLLEDSLFCEEFIQQCPAAVEVLNLVAQECSPGERLLIVEVQCERLRMLYRDCARPPPPPLQADRRQPKEITWSPSRVFPPVRACMFSSHLTAVTFLADPSAGGGLPRGTFIYATSPVPVQAPSFYWEIEIVSYGDTDDDTGPIVSFGFATEAEKRDGAWTNPVGTCLFHNNGRAVHYNGSSLLQWKSVRLDVTLSPGDIAGIGWERTEGTPPPPGQPAKGRVYFTYCGQRLGPYLEDVSGGMWPVVHIQKKNTKVRANFGSRQFAYAEGQAHRNAADLCIDLAEEISANFEALPFAMASDSDNDAGTSIASDSGTHGPPCRIAAVATAQQQYDSDTSCHYKMELSYENFFTSGPDPHPPAIADDESDDDDDDDVPREDHYALLVKAWETKVFPTIRRRFRNEAERKSGLDQIKGALQLGMVDIARQTVEFLYEENGGIPRDLYLPTIEDIKDEANKFTIDKVRKGLTVVTRSPDSNNVASNAVGTALPKFAIRGMLKTFGLHGVVLDVDSVNELVQVETYLRSEGVLVRYWYPIDMLERPPSGYRRTATNGLVTLDNTNIQIHRELLRCEASLARLYCRMALLNIFAPKSPHMFTRLFHIPAIRDITLEHLQLLSNQLLAPPLPDGTISASSILLAQSLQHCIHSQNCSATDLFYQGNSQQIREWLTVAITRTLHQGEESLLELTKQICSFLQTAPEQFPAEEFPISESKVNMDVNFPGAAFVVVSCKESQSGFRKDSSLYKAPWARVFVYGLGHKIKRNGQLNLTEAVCYPRDASPTNTGLTPPPTTNQYPSVIISTDKVHIKLGVSPPPGAVLVLHSLPLEFPLALAFTEQLLTWKSEDGDVKSEDELDTIPASVLLQMVELLGNFLWTTDMAACVKELIFHLLGELLRKIHNLEQKKNPAGLSSSIALQLNPCLAMLMALQSELHKLYDEETQNWGSGNACGGSGVGVADQGRFSTYFHALMEGCLAVAEVTLPINMSVTASVMSSTNAPNLSDSSSSSSSSPGQTPQSPSLLSKRKKVKMKREKTSSSGKRSSSQAAETDTAILNIGGSKPEDMLWFHRALTLLIILRHLTKKDPQGLGVTNDAVADACQALVGATAHSRLLVISGIPTHLEEGIVRSAIRKACNAHGGVFKDEIYIPLQEEDPKKIKDKAGGRECRTELEKATVSSSADSLDISSSSSVTPAMSVSASASTSQASLCSSQGISRTISDISVDQFQASLELAIPPGLLEPHVVSSQESLDLSLCSTGSLGSLGSLGEPLDNVETASVSDVGSMYTVTSLDNQPLMSRPIKGFAVVEIRSRAKIEKIRASLFNSSDLIGLSSLDGEDELMEMSTEEILTVSTVNQSLFDTQGSPVLEDYFNDKSIKGEKLVPGAREVLSEIFKSCVHSEQTLSLTPTKPIKVADIYLSKEQINSQTPGNLLHVFFTNVRPPKKVLEDQLTQILRKYGVPKPKFDKGKYNKAGKEQHPVKVVSCKRPVTKPPAKEKSVLNNVSRTALSEKKPTVKPKSPEKGKPDEKDPEKSPTKKQEVPEEKYLTLDGFHRFVVDRAKQDIRSVWRAILSCGYDLHFERCACIDTRHAQKASRKWTLEMDVALVQYINRLCRHLAITPARLHPHEVYLDPADADDPRVSCLLNVPIESLRLRFALLQSLNTMLETFFLPLVELRQTEMYTNSIAALLQEAKGLIFYDTKVTVMNRVLNATVQRTADHAAPEITLDPLEIVGGEIRSSENSYFCQAARQLACVPSSQLCVKLASGGDPTYAFNIRFTGEEVHGTSGSFRHFLWQVCKELQSSSLSLLLLCPSSAVNKNKGKYILTPSPITYAEEQLLHFFGHLLGIAVRADVPLPLDLLPSFWKTLVGEPLDPDVDLQEADILTYNYVKKFENINDETELEALCAEIASQHLATESPDYPNKPCCKFTYLSMTGEEVELCPRGRHIPVIWENKDIYATAVRNLRLHELQNPDCMTAVRAGLGSIIPLQLLTTLTPLEMELRTCGLPYINLEFLKAHTMYQVGLMETDQHIEFFWGALEMFTQEELCKFIKFACNQERIPFTCPCKDGGPDTAHVPPYPMKIAPPDGAAGSPDSRYIRVETCMFMIKLPQYSSLDIMLEKLRYAVHYREDPLSG
ncbi:probable E3 ubiquitin-protein ligase HECTD4 isoform X6 [Gopherus flavomarginatus]|uniref:probable E3 ubiquitin-protein ligase HECTD4 isoform X6 n=1 Tax=Gopherus flavomarginatus TaxID=286002 RepID=UPI0021CBFDFF|nr:probable E3 ubiquitin-protein ligase HECTD4 isoform X6 [Gopherus flavomarginatus]